MLKVLALVGCSMFAAGICVSAVQTAIVSAVAAFKALGLA